MAISRDWQRYPLAFIDLNAQVGGGGVVVVVVGCMILARQRTLIAADLGGDSYLRLELRRTNAASRLWCVVALLTIVL